MPNSRLHLKIFGHVQGVYFRSGAKQEADKLGLVGWIQNLPNGNIECAAEGERGALEQFLAWCRIGPPGARVEKVDFGWVEIVNNLDGFSIKF